MVTRRNNKINRPSVLDLFCGAGGFSEGFRQQGFSISQGVDKWKPAIDTYNYNFNLNCAPTDILDFEKSVENVEKLPDTDVIVGSPPCICFSTSNRSGNADKTQGIKLIHAFLRIIAIKKFKQKSILKAWFMENVPNSIKYLKQSYSFLDLGLGKWAKQNGYNPNKTAIMIAGNCAVLTASDYGTPQLRKRAIVGEIIRHDKMVFPNKSNAELTLGFIKKALPSPLEGIFNKEVQDPLYPRLKIKAADLTDHFYDTGLYEVEWALSQNLKINHPYMGKMSFPEREDRPSRTITATKIGSSREAHIYKSEYKRKQDGEYRTPTLREAATLMGFPITYQFLGSENTKWKLVGNAVCPPLSSALATVVRKALHLPRPKNIPFSTKLDSKKIVNLNCHTEKIFKSPPQKKVGARFRNHLFKEKNTTVTFSNYDIVRPSKKGKWFTSVQHGTGKNFVNITYKDNYYKKLRKIILKSEEGARYIDEIESLSKMTGSSQILQRTYEAQERNQKYLEPRNLLKRIEKIITKYKIKDLHDQCKTHAELKNIKTRKQIMAIYAVNRVSSFANSKAVAHKKRSSICLKDSKNDC